MASNNKNKYYKKRSLFLMGVFLALGGGGELAAVHGFAPSSTYSRTFTSRPSFFDGSSIVSASSSSRLAAPQSPRGGRRALSTNLGAKNNRSRGRGQAAAAAATTTTSVLALPMFMGGAATTTTTASSSSSVLSSMLVGLTAADPVVVEAELLTDLSHVSLDLITLLGPATLVVRTAAVLGRLCAMAADYLPDHSVVPTELAFQSFMLGIAWIGMIKAALPLALSHIMCQNISLRDGKLYTSLFRPAGLSWEQFKALSVYALEWVTDVPAGAVIDSTEQKTNAGKHDDAIYWLYNGQVRVTSQDRELYTASSAAAISSLRNQSNNFAFLWGEESSLFRRQQQQQPTATADNPTITTTHTTLQAGTGGATLVRLNLRKLHQLMDSDPALAESMRTLVFQGMQAKLMAAHLSAQQGNNNNSGNQERP